MVRMASLEAKTHGPGCPHFASLRLAAIRSRIHWSTSASIQPTARPPSETGRGKRPWSSRT